MVPLLNFIFINFANVFGPLIALFNPEFFEGLGDNELSLGSSLFVARNLAIGLAFLLLFI